MIDLTKQRELCESWLTQAFRPLPDYALQRQSKSYDKYSTPETQWRWKTWLTAVENQP